MSKIKPFLRWAGGKQNLVDELLKHAPDDALINRYYEPFLGAGSLFFANGFDNAFISDVNPHLINAYQKIRTDYERIHKQIRSYETKYLNDENFYYAVRETFNKNLDKNDYSQAARFIFLVHANYNGMYRVNTQGKYNVPIGKRKPSLPSLSDLKKVSAKLTGKRIKNISYQEILNSVEEKDFIYLDPPYPPLNWEQHQQQFTEDKFSKEDQEELSAFALELWARGCYVMISNSDIALIRTLYTGWNISTLETTRWVSCKSKRSERVVDYELLDCNS
jgi:DNA adenine methylase